MTIPERIEQLAQQEAQLSNLVTLKREELRVAELRLAEASGRRAELQSINFEQPKSEEDG